jgi:hypothetical protein
VSCVVGGGDALNKKMMLVALVALILLTVALTLSNVSAGDKGGGGADGMIKAAFNITKSVILV